MKEKKWPLKKTDLLKITKKLSKKVKELEKSSILGLDQCVEISRDVFLLEKTKILLKTIGKANNYPEDADDLIKRFYKSIRNHKFFEGDEVDSIVSDFNNNFYNLYSLSQDKLDQDSFKKISYYLIKFYRDNNPDKKQYVHHKEVYKLISKALKNKKEGTKVLKRIKKSDNILSFPETHSDYELNVSLNQIKNIVKTVFYSMNISEIDEIVSYVIDNCIINTDFDMDTCIQFDHFGYWPIIITPKIETYVDLAILVHEVGHALHSVLTGRYCEGYEDSITDVLFCEFIANYFMNKFLQMSCCESFGLDSDMSLKAHESIVFSRTYNEAFWLVIEDNLFNKKLSDNKDCDNLFKKIANRFYPKLRLKKSDINWESNTHFLDRFRTHDAFLSFVMSKNFLKQEENNNKLAELIFILMKSGKHIDIKELIGRFGSNFSINLIASRRSRT